MLEVPPPPEQIFNASVFSDTRSADAAVAGLYIEMMAANNLPTSGSTTFFGGLSADELWYFTPGFRDEFTINEISVTSHSHLNQSFWVPCYKRIYAANACIEGLYQSRSINTQIKNQLLGEAMAIRAFHYFLLINLFGEVPLVITTDYSISSATPRTPIVEVQAQIIADLTQAVELLPTGIESSAKSRINKWAAKTLLAKAHLYQRNWTKVIEHTESIIDEAGFRLESNIERVFFKDSPEAIWQMYSVDPRHNTFEASIILPANDRTTPNYLLTDYLLQDFESGDLRKTHWTKDRTFNGSTLTYPNKYKIRGGTDVLPVHETYSVFRLAEVLLMHAEANAQLGHFEEASIALNVIRQRAGLPPLDGLNEQTWQAAVEHERRVELFAEWGNRWFDLKRTGRAQEVLSAINPATWQSSDTLWPIPQQQLQLNPRLTQNVGY